MFRSDCRTHPAGAGKAHSTEGAQPVGQQTIWSVIRMNAADASAGFVRGIHDALNQTYHGNSPLIWVAVHNEPPEGC